MTPLHTAVSFGNLRSTKDLLLRGADRNAKSHDGRKAIEMINAEDQKDRNKFRKILVSHFASDLILFLENSLVYRMPTHSGITLYAHREKQ